MLFPPRMRPRVDRVVSLPPDEVLRRVRKAIEAQTCAGTASPGHLDLCVTRERQRLFSPHLNLELQPSELGTRMHGYFGPNPHVWALYLAMYSTLAFIAIVGLCVGLAQLTLGQLSWGLLAVPGAGLGAAAVYGSAFIGQRLSAEQMEMLEAVLAGALDGA